MATQKQIKANRKNAKKSTGPKTAEGKEKVSKNAVKHGLFAAEAVVTGENAADYEAYLESFLTEMKPVGAVENMLVERFVSLSWRLLRAQRMQNQVIENFIEKEVTNPLPRRTRVLTCHAQGIPLGDKRCTSSHLPLGRIADSDFSYYRVLERMFMYERRIELSMLRINRELKKIQIMRQVEQRQITQDHAIEKAETFRGKSINLKKQSQFMPDIMGATPFTPGGYGVMPPFEIDRNKTNQSQIAGKIMHEGSASKEKLPSTATG
jgi:hypothetical protein